MDFSTWTREDFKAFDARRDEVMKPTAEEIAAQQAAYEAAMLSRAQSALSGYGITLTGTETDFSDLYRQYISGTPDMKEWLGEDLEGQIAYRVANGNDLRSFVGFVLSYEA